MRMLPKLTSETSARLASDPNMKMSSFRNAGRSTLVFREERDVINGLLEKNPTIPYQEIMKTLDGMNLRGSTAVIAAVKLGKETSGLKRPTIRNLQTLQRWQKKVNGDTRELSPADTENPLILMRGDDGCLRQMQYTGCIKVNQGEHSYLLISLN